MNCAAADDDTETKPLTQHSDRHRALHSSSYPLNFEHGWRRALASCADAAGRPLTFYSRPLPVFLFSELVKQIINQLPGKCQRSIMSFSFLQQ